MLLLANYQKASNFAKTVPGVDQERIEYYLSKTAPWCHPIVTPQQKRFPAKAENPCYYWRARRDSNPRPMDSKSSALSS